MDNQARVLSGDVGEELVPVDRFTSEGGSRGGRADGVEVGIRERSQHGRGEGRVGEGDAPEVVVEAVEEGGEGGGGDACKVNSKFPERG